MLIVEDWAEIRRLRKSEGVPISEIARLMGCSRNTVKAALASDEPLPQPPRGVGSPDQWVGVFLAFQSQAWHTDDRTGHALAEPAVPDRTVRIVAALVNPTGPAP